VTQLIARRVREAGVYCEIVPFGSRRPPSRGCSPRASSCPDRPHRCSEPNGPRIPQRSVFDSGLPMLGICYGQQALMHQLGGKCTGDHGEFGRAFIEIVDRCALFDGLWAEGERHQVWMSHGDKVTRLAPGFRPVAASAGAPFAVIADDERRIYGDAVPPRSGPHARRRQAARTSSATSAAVPATGRWPGFRKTKIAEIRAQVGEGRVICGLSGGVDSAVAAVLIHEAIGDQLTCVFVDHGLMRLGEASRSSALFRDHYNIPLVHVDASERCS
jgi:GMP synthase (glutamine-hydrolysing)